MKRINSKRLFLILTLLWMGVIFFFSSRNGDTSIQDSNRVGQLAGEIFVPGYEDWTSEEQDEFAARIDHPIRKTAHALEYALLGMLVFGAVYMPQKRNRYNLMLSWLIATVYAVSDEVHQLYVPGRSGQVSDVCLDSCGVLAGVLIVLVVTGAYQKKHLTDKKLQSF